MNSQALFGISALMSFLAFGVVTKIYIWPRLRVMRRADALIAFVVPHTFRFIGLSFLIPRGRSISSQQSIKARSVSTSARVRWVLRTSSRRSFVPPLLVTLGLIFWRLLRKR